MKIISKYINRVVLESFVIILVIFCSLFFVVGMVRESSTIGQNDYHLLEAVMYVLLQMPTKIGDMIPLVCLLSGMVSLGIFATHNELTIFRVSGISIYRISYILLKSCLIISIFAMLLQEYIAPQAYKFSEQNKLYQKSGGKVVRTKSGIWTREGDDYIFIGRVLETKLTNVVKYSFEHQKLKEMVFAKEIIVEKNLWHAKNIKFTKIYEDKIFTKELSQAIWRIQVPLKYILLDTADPANLTLRELAGYVFWYKDSNTFSDRYIWVFWDRLAIPFKTIVMLLLAVPIILGPLRDSNLGLRVIVGSLIGVTFYFFSMFLGPLSVLLQVNPLIEVFIPIIIFLLVGLYLLRCYR